jgi:hypothetical protein
MILSRVNAGGYAGGFFCFLNRESPAPKNDLNMGNSSAMAANQA